MPAVKINSSVFNVSPWIAVLVVAVIITAIVGTTIVVIDIITPSVSAAEVAVVDSVNVVESVNSVVSPVVDVTSHVVDVGRVASGVEVDVNVVGVKAVSVNVGNVEKEA